MLQYFALVLALVVGAVSYFGVKNSVFKALNAYRKFRVLLLRLRGKTPEGEVERRVVSGQAWEDFCDALKASGASLLSAGCPSDPFNQAEGYRYLTRLVRAGLENFMESTDVDAPQLVSVVDGLRVAPCKIGADNPDNLYESAQVSSRYAYKMVVEPGTVNYLGFGSQSGSFGGPGGLKTVDYKEAREMDKEGDGSIEIYFSTERPEGVKNWLRFDAEVEKAMIIVRQTFLDRESEVAAKGKIVRVDKETDPQPITCEKVNEALNATAMLVGAVPMLFANWANGFQQHVNQLPLFDQGKSDRMGGDPNIRYYHSYWKLEDDEALVISATPPEVEHWNFQLNNHWMESLDYRYYKIHVNKHTAHYRTDGSVRIVVTHRDPELVEGMDKAGAYDWIHTTGHNLGTMLFRWVKPKTEVGLPQPMTEVVKVKDLPSRLAE